MAKFTTRVELINATWEHYETLHQEMEDRDFTRTITDATTGVEYNLPPAEYNRDGNYTREQTFEAAKEAMNATNQKGRILVTPTGGRIWYNLEKP